LVAAGADHYGGLRTLHDRLVRQTPGAELRGARQRGEADAERRARLVETLVAAVLQLIARRRDQVLAVLVLAIVPRQCEEAPRGDAPAVGRGANGLELDLELLDPRAAVLVAVGTLEVLTGIVVDLVVVVRVLVPDARFRSEVGARLLRIVVVRLVLP